ncbi:hypothetical protein [Mycolicibacterium goodii]|uniref:hypothetical protein n=1 Tax=Mycolicibacterium goodii TaxID=134601 RepID=UPI00256F02DA|nr:hypothetical protein [Mycolicibacterium goodii]
MTDKSNPAPSWLHERAAGLVARVGERGMTLTVEAAETILAERHTTAAAQLGVTERTARAHLDDAALDALADRLVATFANEEPGSDLFTLPRTAHISVASFGLLVAGLAETLLFLESHRARSPRRMAASRPSRQRSTWWPPGPVPGPRRSKGWRRPGT